MGRFGTTRVSLLIYFRENQTLLRLVLCSSQNVGVIVRLERENFHVLGMNGKCIECKPTALHKRRENRNTVALDADQNQIRRRDIVKVMEGPHAVSSCISTDLWRFFK